MRNLAVTLLLLVLAATGAAQRRITPVTPAEPGAPAAVKDAKGAATDSLPSGLAQVRDRRGNIVLVDTVTGLEWVDSTRTRIPRMRYPLVSGMAVGVNVFDGLMRVCGQKWGVADVSYTLMMHNRYFIVGEAGLGLCRDTPDGLNYTYRSPLAPYFRLGADYNPFYNGEQAYQFTAGVRYGFSAFSFSVDDVTVDSPYWDTPAHFSIPAQHATAGWLEIALGLRVRIAGPVSAGWTVRYKQRLHCSGRQHGDPMYIPGFGKWQSNFGASLTFYYSFRCSPPDGT